MSVTVLKIAAARERVEAALERAQARHLARSIPSMNDRQWHYVAGCLVCDAAAFDAALAALGRRGVEELLRAGTSN